ncbi:hypothetical protein Dda_4201 [Drechslerella dactyloides]|uniref:Uncharacterized protein n=1 Tax=Drechslerella dactyloides TaxID=74499 RepID=A0AAD6IZR8_DREDA|nr:hypothetical protein Dda_4201 [Drechslerella dactyloides]
MPCKGTITPDVFIDSTVTLPREDWDLIMRHRRILENWLTDDEVPDDWEPGRSQRLRQRSWIAYSNSKQNMPCGASLEPSAVARDETPTAVWDWLMRKQLVARRTSTADGSLPQEEPIVEVMGYIDRMATERDAQQRRVKLQRAIAS